HALVPTKRGAHLALSIERLEVLCDRRLQRIGLSATQRPLDERAGFLVGVESSRSPSPASAKGNRRSDRARPSRRTPKSKLESAEAEVADEFATSRGQVRYRPVTIVDAGAKKALSLTIEVPVEDMA